MKTCRVKPEQCVKSCGPEPAQKYVVSARSKRRRGGRGRSTSPRPLPTPCDLLIKSAMSRKAAAEAAGLPGGTVAMPVPPHPSAKAARARALAKEWGPPTHKEKRGREVANLAQPKQAQRSHRPGTSAWSSCLPSARHLLRCWRSSASAAASCAALSSGKPPARIAALQLSEQCTT